MVAQVMIPPFPSFETSGSKPGVVEVDLRVVRTEQSQKA